MGQKASVKQMYGDGASHVVLGSVLGNGAACEKVQMLMGQVVMAWNADGSLLASASQKGTVLRVHRLPQAAKAFTFRRASAVDTSCCPAS